MIKNKKQRIRGINIIIRAIVAAMDTVGINIIKNLVTKIEIIEKIEIKEIEIIEIDHLELM